MGKSSESDDNQIQSQQHQGSGNPMSGSMLPKLNVVRRAGSERFYSNHSEADFNLEDFWQWALSDLVNNTTRGALAEYIVAKAVGTSTAEVRDAWAAFDLETPDGITVEVKSSSYVQSWAQSSLSSISFDISPSQAWDGETNTFDDKPKRQATVYVFALLAHRDKTTVDPINLDQWKFYVLSTGWLNEHFLDQKKISLSKLSELASQIDYGELKSAILQVVPK